MVCYVSNEETYLQDFFEAFEDMSPGYYMDSDVINVLGYSITPWCVTRIERVNTIFIEYIYYRMLGKCYLNY